MYLYTKKLPRMYGGKSGSGSHPTGYKLIDNFYILSIIGVKIWKVCYNDKNLCELIGYRMN